MKLYNNKTNELRRVFRKFSLRVNSLERISIGPYRVSEVPYFGEVKEVVIRDEIRHLMGLYYKEKLSAAVDTWNQKTKLLLSKSQQQTLVEDLEENDSENMEQNLLTSKNVIDSVLI